VVYTSKVGGVDVTDMLLSCVQCKIYEMVPKTGIGSVLTQQSLSEGFWKTIKKEKSDSGVKDVLRGKFLGV
jgi:hypothetical protein